ncbi:urease accessory protein UreE [Halalkalibacterium ligniniphilum]|uniref:urease accessory protein UreE n=1 Tax=Halalkalibacterium ligniniphilum TaxID=1134413 RepID=UPI00034C3DCC|nr:urease accessory protein UreE [Halalkalibacterium ligniniphilum]
MRVQKVLGNIESIDTCENTVEWVELDWDELNKRILRKTTDKGRDLAIVMDEQGLRYGDILHQESSRVIAVRTRLEPAYVITPDSMTQMGKVAFELGNRHTPCVVEENRIIVRYDSTLEVLFKEIGVDYERTEERFKQPFKYKSDHHHHT